MLHNGSGPGVCQIEGGQGKSALNTCIAGLANDPEYFRLAFAVMDRMFVYAAVEIVVWLRVHAFFRGNKNPAVDARRFRHHKMPFALHQIASNKGAQPALNELVHHTLGFAFIHFLLDDINSITRKHFLHLFGRQEHIPPLIQSDESEAAVGGFNRPGRNDFAFLNIRL